MDYLILLGGPFAAAILAKYAVVTKTATGTLGKTATVVADPSAQGTTANPKATDVGGAVTNDAGNLDIIDAQYFLFNLVAFAIFAIAFISKNVDPGVMAADGAKYELPAIPGILLGLTGVSATAYVGNKFAQTSRPRISAIEPATNVTAGKDVLVLGVNLVPSGGSGDLASQTTIRLMFMATATAASSGRSQLVNATMATASRVKFKMPVFQSSEVGTVELAIVTADGLVTDNFYITVAV